MEMVGKCSGNVAVLFVYKFFVAYSDSPSSANPTAGSVDEPIWYRGVLARALSSDSLAEADAGSDVGLVADGVVESFVAAFDLVLLAVDLVVAAFGAAAFAGDVFKAA